MVFVLDLCCCVFFIASGLGPFGVFAFAFG